MSQLADLSGLTWITLSALIISVSGCVSQSTPMPTIAPTDAPSTATPRPTAIPPTTAPTATPTATPAPTATPPPQLSFEAATYRDESAGFEVDYPASWTADPPLIGGARGYFAQLTSWERTPGELPDEIPAGGTIMTINVLLWDPKNALDQYVDHFKTNWSASAIRIVTEEVWDIDVNWRAVQFLIAAPDHEALYLLTTIGERYLVLSGTGDLQLLSEIAGTLRPIADQDALQGLLAEIRDMNLPLISVTPVAMDDDLYTRGDTMM